MKKTIHFGFGLLLFAAPNLFAQELTCDDFMDPSAYPEAFYSGEGLEGEIIGYTQDETQTITIGEHSDSWTYCNFSSSLGIFTGGVTLDFAFDGTNQFARFHTGESDIGPGNGRSFSVNGSTYTSLYSTFPMVIDGVTIDLDTVSAPDLIIGYYDIYLSFTGEIDEISIRGEDFHESSIVALCIGSLFEADACDDFEDTELFPAASYGADALIGYSQGETQAITTGPESFAWVNESQPGIYGVGSVDFDFDGTNQTVRFEVYGFLGQFDQMGFSVNESSLVYLDDTFPMTVSGVEVFLDMSPSNIDDWEYVYLTFKGEIDVVSHLLFESGVTELCVDALTEEVDDAGIETLTKSSVSIYPNPAVNYVRVETKNIIDQLSIYSLSGQEMINKTIGKSYAKLDLSELVPGMYLIKITEQNGTETIEKLIRE